MGFLQNLTDDQTAILGCAVALLAAFTVMCMSARLGSATRGVQTQAGDGDIVHGMPGSDAYREVHLPSWKGKKAGERTT